MLTLILHLPKPPTYLTFLTPIPLRNKMAQPQAIHTCYQVRLGVFARAPRFQEMDFARLIVLKAVAEHV
jgi:hypothetical protein